MVLFVTPLMAALALQVPVTTGPPDSVTAGGHRAPAVYAAPLHGTIHIDGRLNEPAWAAAKPATHFTQLDPHEGAPPTERTAVRILIGPNALYIGARMYDDEPQKIKAVLARRDDPVQSDLFEVFLDPYHDHLTAVRFRINPAGSIRDAILGAASQGGADDPSWDPVWSSAARIDSLGWTAEMRIPLSQLHFNRRPNAVWGIQMGRLIFRKGETDFFAFTPKSETAGVNRYGHLVGLGDIKPQRRLELLPYTLGRATVANVAPGDPFHSGHDVTGATGVDLKYGLTSDLTLNATVNPDFGQVEVDPAVVNLSAFETFYPEKRPFFVEGADVFRFGGIRSHNSAGFPQVFFSRRIGRAPQRALGGPNERFPDAPEQTTILSAAKLSGRTSGGWSVGMVDAVTANEQGRYVDSAGTEHTTPVEPLTNYFVGRVRKDLRAGNSTIGGLLTAVDRRLTDPALRSLLRSNAYVGGVDFTNSWQQRKWSLDGSVAVSRVEGSANAMLLTQESSARYFQRPDRQTNRLDPTRTSLGGHAFQVALSKNGGLHSLGSLTYQETSPGFEVNDLGFEQVADRRALSELYGYIQNRPRRVVRNWSTFAFANQLWNFDGDFLYGGFGLLSNINFANFWFLGLRSDFVVPGLDPSLTRGGPLAAVPRNQDVQVNVTTDSRKTTQGSAKWTYKWDTAGQWRATYTLSLSLRPSPAVHVSVGPALTKNYSLAQYVATVAAPQATATYGTRYIFATLDQTEVSLETRVDWTFTPRLSFQLYLQPLISAGDYGDLKELRAPRTFDFVVYGRDRGSTTTPVANGIAINPGDGGAQFVVPNNDFNFRSLRGNAVLRWEYRPGSTLYVIWQQNRQGVAPVGDFQLSRDLSGLFDAPARNLFAVKLSYWLDI